MMESQKQEVNYKSTESRSARCFLLLSVKSGRGMQGRWVIDSKFPLTSFQSNVGMLVQARIAINVNVAANVLLVAAKAIAAIFSSSLSLLASLADSVLDLLSMLFLPLNTTSVPELIRKSAHSDNYHFLNYKTRCMAFSKIVTDVSSRKKKAATLGNTRLQRYYGSFIPSDFTRSSHSIMEWCTSWPA